MATKPSVPSRSQAQAALAVDIGIHLFGSFGAHTYPVSKPILQS